MRKELLIDREILHNGKYKMSQVLQYCLVFARRYFQSGKGFTRVLIFLITVYRQKAAQQERWAGVVVKPVSQAGLVSL